MSLQKVIVHNELRSFGSRGDKIAGEWGADIAAGDAQSLGMPLNYGGPYLGYLCATKDLIRKMPGRIVGATTDDAGAGYLC